MADSLLSAAQKAKIVRSISKENFKQVISVLDSVKTLHSGTAKMKDKRFTIAEIVKYIIEKFKGTTDKQLEKIFYSAGKKICAIKSDNAKEVGVHVIWRGYDHDKKSVTAALMKIADDPNWEVREYAAGAISATVYKYKDFYNTLEKWRKHPSENVRRAVVMSAWGLRDRQNPTSALKAFALLEPLLYDSSVYVKKNLGPFAIGSWYGNAFPKETLKQLDKWVKIKNENVRWNVAMAFNNSFGNKYPDRALKFLKTLSKDKSKIVRKAVTSTLRTLRKRHIALINQFIQQSGLTI
jgi:3-methyladenine DNA glycosylase AlkD